jgi:hypothetical protein
MSGGQRDKKSARGKPIIPDYRQGGEDPQVDPIPPIDFKPPLKPHKKLFIALFIVFAAWVILLLVLYFRTVYPARHG